MFDLSLAFKNSFKIAALVCGLVCSLSSQSYAHNSNWLDKNNRFWTEAPKSLIGRQMILKIEAGDTGEATTPKMGAIRQSYAANGEYLAENFGEADRVINSGEYYYKRKNLNSAIENLIEQVSGEEIRTLYRFETSNSGTWERHYLQQGARLSGHFDLVPLQAATDDELAPDSHNGVTVVLNILETESVLPAGVYPTQGVVLQSYEADGSYVGLGFGPATINHHGSYDFEKIAQNVVVERTTQIAETFTLDYTMTYTYDTKNSGRWFQNFGNGLILFSGTFTTFQTR